MIKKRKILIFFFCLLFAPVNAFAANITYGYYGTTSSTASTPIYANSSNGDANHWLDVSVAGSGHGYVVWGMDDGTGHLVESSRNAVPANNVHAPSNAIAFWLESSDGGEIYATVGHTDNDNNLTVYFTNSSGSSGGSSGGSSSTSCDACQIFSCPGWDQYMQGLQDIKNAIPPAPNWQMVADTFNNTITPSVISDLSSLLGSVSDPPAIPAAPATPDLPSDLDNHGITAPTGQEGSSTFNGDDIKNQAQTIQERQDPTGGFSILDPIAGLPSQDEFKANKPTEGANPTPANPKDPDNVAPNPTEGSNTAPNPTEGANPTPANPKDPANVAPNPTEGSNTAPTPSGTGGGYDTAPVPKRDGSTAPIPGNDGSTAPIPGQNNDSAPIPGQ
jgi:hypothetical protein